MVNKPFELKLDEYVDFVDPAEYDVVLDKQALEIITVVPAQYFITSGDAIQKVLILNRDYWAAAGAARKLLSGSKNKKHAKFCSDLWRMAGKCRVLLNKLRQVKGEHVFLETEWSPNRTIWCLPKDPRKKDPEM